MPTIEHTANTILEESSISNAASQCKELFPPTKNTLHLSFIIPGILYPEKSPSQIDASSALLTFRTNTLGPMLMLKHFSPFLPIKRTASKDQKSDNHDNDASYPSPNPEFQGLPPISVTATMSARVGSISDNNLGGWYSYRASKAAVNQLVKTFDRYLYTRAGDAAVALALHPGTVRTGLSKEFWGSVKSDKLFEKEWVAERLVGVVKGDVVDGEVREEGKDGEWSSRTRGRVLDLRGRCWDWAGKEILP